ncbi:hypothetical protein ACWY7G_004430 [Enterobacter hormaechei]|jgi:hypothetical protein|nr:hypothetical protein [Salmonella enterica]ELC9643887.1 hypothetical protein [Escherichia coli]HDS3409359.1 hypothetical protein [Citrobacter freundii]EEO5337806.1 hypothetical protein [Salmonella enterica]EJV5633028.1 hypothetical protein [Salmonella enterica]
MQKPKRRLGFMVGKSNATLPADDETEAELDQEVLKLFYPNQETQDTIERSEAGTDVFTATDAPDLFKKLKL